METDHDIVVTPIVFTTKKTASIWNVGWIFSSMGFYMVLDKHGRIIFHFFFCVIFAFLMNCTVSYFQEHAMKFSNIVFENVNTYLKRGLKNLFSDNASKGGSQQSTRQGCLKETSNKKVHIGYCPGERRVPRRKVKILDLEKIQNI